MTKKFLWIVPLAFGASCADSNDPALTDIQVSVQEMRSGQGVDQSFVSLDVLVTAAGEAVSCDTGHLSVRLSASDSADGPFIELPTGDYRVRCTSDERADVALVVDNSGSEQGFLEWLQQAAKVMVDAVLPVGGRASLVRVSTDSSVWLEPTSDRDLLYERIDELFINNGWTALYDGIRMGNETLGGTVEAGAMYDGVDDFCAADRKLGLVVFTDGRENNSSHQSYWSEDYPGDGLDTTLEDLRNLRVGGVPTPLYIVGLGNEVDHIGLSELATDSGGRYLAVETESELPGVYEVISEYLSSSVKLCTELPADLCGKLYVKVEYSWSPCEEGAACDAEPVEGSEIFAINRDCPLERRGKSATMLLTLSNPGISESVAMTLAANAASWVAPEGEAPRVLVVKDDNHHGEFADDAEYVFGLLAAAGVDATLISESSSGLTLADTSTYNVVWLSNPGYPPNNRDTLYTIAEFASEGGGYVLQGDDFTWFWGDAGFSMTPYTGLVHQNNGTSFCGRPIDNNATPYRYRVMVEGEAHPLITGIEDVSFLYGDDIDHSVPAGEGEEVLAWADGVDQDGKVFCETRIPVIVSRQP